MAKSEIINNDALTVRVNAEAVKDTAEAVVEAVEGTVERVEYVVKNNPYLIAGVAIVALGVGGYVGYRVAIKRLVPHYDAILEKEIAATKAAYKRMAKTDEFSTVEGAAQVLIPAVTDEDVEQAGQALVNYQGGAREEIVARGERAVRSRIMVAPQDDQLWNQELENARRDPEKPYIISQDEHAENEPSHVQLTITWYEGDLVLADEREVPIDDADGTIGLDNLRFGYGSGDPKTVLVRNERLGVDFEVVLHEDKFTKVVHGFDTPEEPPAKELRHSAQQRRRSASE